MEIQLIIKSGPFLPADALDRMKAAAKRLDVSAEEFAAAALLEKLDIAEKANPPVLAVAG